MLREAVHSVGWMVAGACILGVGVDVSSRQRIPQVELTAPGGFDAAGPCSRESSFTYQIDATLFIPLVFVSVPVRSQDNVGVASASVRDCAAPDGFDLRTYEFFASSIPDRSRGLNRLGFLREAALLGRAGVSWTAHFGVVSATREATRAEAEEHFDRPQSTETYTILDGFTNSEQTWSTTVQLALDGRWPTSSALYADLRPRWSAVAPDEETTLLNEGGRLYFEPVGFLGAFEHSLQVAASDVAHTGSPRRFRYSFVHNGKVFHLDLEGHSIDERRGDDYIHAGLVEPGALVHKLNYRIINSESDAVQSFQLWTELPGTERDPLAPILPLAFEFKARSFLNLRAVRTLTAAQR